MPKNKYKRLIVDISVFITGIVLTKVVQFALLPLYTTYMTAESYGVAELTNNMSELLFPIVTLCIYEAAFRYVVGSKFSKEEIITASIKTLSFTAIISAIILLICNYVFKYEFAGYLYFILYAYSFKMLLAYYVRGKGFTKIFAVSGIITAVSLALFSYVFVVHLHWDVKGYLLSIAFSNVCSLLFLFIGGKLYQEIKWDIKTKDVTRELLHYSTPLIVYNIGYWLTIMTGRFILLWLTDASTVGEYAAVIKLAAIINIIQQAFFAAFQLNASREYNSSDKEMYYSNIFKIYAIAVLMFGSIILCLSPFLSNLTLKNEFYNARIYLPLVLLIAIIDCLFVFFKTMYTTYKLTKKAIPSMFIGVGINFVIGMITASKYGIWGICIASLLCYTAQAIYQIIDVRKFVNIKCDWGYIITYLGLLCVQVFLLSFGNFKGILFSGVIAIYVVISSIFLYRKVLFRMVTPLLKKEIKA